MSVYDKCERCPIAVSQVRGHGEPSLKGCGASESNPEAYDYIPGPECPLDKILELEQKIKELEADQKLRRGPNTFGIQM